MDENCKEILNTCGIYFTDISGLDGVLIMREQLLNDDKYNSLKPLIQKLKTVFSSSLLTSLQKSATSDQRWPLLNLVRQILNQYGFLMEPIRKCDGYTPSGIKKYKRFFLIKLRKDV